MKELPNIFYYIPHTTTTITSKEDLKELLINTKGKIITQGKVWNIKSMQLKAGVYKVFLVQA